MLAVYILVAGLMIAGLLILLTWLGRRIILRKGPTAGFIVAALMGVSSGSLIGPVIRYFIELIQATGLKDGIYHLFFTAAVAIPLVTGLCCSLLLWMAAMTARRKKRRRLHQRG